MIFEDWVVLYALPFANNIILKVYDIYEDILKIREARDISVKTKLV